MLAGEPLAGLALTRKVPGVAHLVQAVLPALGPLETGQGHQGLLAGHLVGAAPSGGVDEALAGAVEGEQSVQQGAAVFHKPGVLQGDAQFAQSNHHLGAALPVGHPLGGEGAVRVLQPGQAGEALGDRLLYVCLVLVPGQGLEGHGGEVRVSRSGFGQVPAAPRQLAGENVIHIHLPGGLGLGLGVLGHGVVPAVQGQQGPDGAVDPLPDGLVIVPQGLG